MTFATDLDSAAIWAKVALSNLEREYPHSELRRLAGPEDIGRTAYRQAMAPLVARITADLSAWLARATYPVRTGLHSNSAFSLSLCLDFARREVPGLARTIQATWSSTGLRHTRFC
ncbi:MAG: DUF2891 family protein [Acidimicrobiales bacterium]